MLVRLISLRGELACEECLVMSFSPKFALTAIPNDPNRRNREKYRMAPTRTVRSKFAASKSENSKGLKKSSLGSSGIKKSKPSKGAKPPPPPKQQKTKPSARPAKRKRRVYTEKELGLPKLNTITPVGVDLPKGKKKGKVFVDDQVGELLPDPV